MDTLFFWTSKLGWILFSPGNLILLLFITAWLALLAGKQKFGQRLLACSCALFLLIAVLPLSEWLLTPLERRFDPNPALPSSVNGIIVLGGSVAPGLSAIWGQPQLNNSAERLTGFLDLAIRYPNARMIFTGGSGSLRDQESKEADVVDQVFYQLGFVNHGIQFERESRNTYENAVLSKAMMAPKPGETWILVTSAAHMPRAVGVFCAQQWPVIPYPVDFNTSKGDLLRIELNAGAHLSDLNGALREWAGLLAYRLSGKSSSLLPGKAEVCTR